MRKQKAYSPEQIAGTERAIKILQAMPKDTRDMTAIVTSAFVDGLLAGQILKESESCQGERASRQAQA